VTFVFKKLNTVEFKMDETSDEVTFIPETVEPIVYDIIESVLKDKMFTDLNTQKWIDEICARITKDLVDMNKPFKYIGQLCIYLNLPCSSYALLASI